MDARWKEHAATALRHDEIHLQHSYPLQPRDHIVCSMIHPQLDTSINNITSIRTSAFLQHPLIVSIISAILVTRGGAKSATPNCRHCNCGSIIGRQAGQVGGDGSDTRLRPFPHRW